MLPEYGCQAALTAVLLLTGHWLYGGLHAVLLAYHARQVRCACHAVLCRPGLSEPARWCSCSCLAAALQPCCQGSPQLLAHPALPPPLLQFMRRQHMADVTEIFRQARQLCLVLDFARGSRNGVRAGWHMRNRMSCPVSSGCSAVHGCRLVCGAARLPCLPVVCRLLLAHAGYADAVCCRWAPASSASWPSSSSTSSLSSWPSTSERVQLNVASTR